MKHQSEHYRTWAGERWVAWGDMPKPEAKDEVRRLIRLGLRARKLSVDSIEARVYVPAGQRAA